jgi:ribosomal protein S18 acetylase RimI-like enzyme
MAALHVQCWRESYADMVPAELIRDVNFAARLPIWEKSLADETRIVYGAYDGSKAVGLLIAGRDNSSNVDGPDGHLAAIYIAQSHKRNGIGRHLIALAAQDWKTQGGKSLWLGVLSNNKDSIAFYESLGAKFVREQTYRWGEHDLPNAIYVFEDLPSLIP